MMLLSFINDVIWSDMIIVFYISEIVMGIITNCSQAISLDLLHVTLIFYFTRHTPIGMIFSGGLH